MRSMPTPAVDLKVAGAEFFRKGGSACEVVKGKRWLLLSRPGESEHAEDAAINALFALNPARNEAYLLKEAWTRLWSYRYEGAMLRYLKNWIDQLRGSDSSQWRSWRICCFVI